METKRKFTFLNVLPLELQDLILLQTDIFTILHFSPSDHVVRALLKKEYITIKRLMRFKECNHTLEEKKKLCGGKECDCDIFCCLGGMNKKILNNHEIYELLQFHSKIPICGNRSHEFGRSLSIQRECI